LEREGNFRLRDVLSVASCRRKSRNYQRGGDCENLLFHGLSPFSFLTLDGSYDSVTVELRSLWPRAQKTAMHCRGLASELRMNR
jgi:hypothetical protein